MFTSALECLCSKLVPWLGINFHQVDSRSMELTDKPAENSCVSISKAKQPEDLPTYKSRHDTPVCWPEDPFKPESSVESQEDKRQTDRPCHHRTHNNIGLEGSAGVERQGAP